MTPGDIYRYTATGTNLVDPVTSYVGNPSADHLAHMRSHAIEMAAVAELPSMDLPRPCRALLDAAHEAGVPWSVSQGERDGEVRTDLDLYGLNGSSPRPLTYTWFGNRLFTYGLPMPLRQVHQRIAELRAEEHHAR